MAKLASSEEKRFSPISQKLLDAVSGPVPGQNPVSVDTADNTQREEAKVVLMRSTVLEHSPESPRSEEKPELEQESEERLTRIMRYHVSPTEKDETEEFIHRLSAAAKVTLTHSNIMRACRDILFQVEDRLLVEFTKARLRRPINDKRAIAFFESRLTEIIQTAIRQTPLVHNRSGRE
jgi:hypothetical protein